MIETERKLAVTACLPTGLLERRNDGMPGGTTAALEDVWSGLPEKGNGPGNPLLLSHYKSANDSWKL